MRQNSSPVIISRLTAVKCLGIFQIPENNKRNTRAKYDLKLQHCFSVCSGRFMFSTQMNYLAAHQFQTEMIQTQRSKIFLNHVTQLC